jgi:hypothetical protein
MSMHRDNGGWWTVVALGLLLVPAAGKDQAGATGAPMQEAVRFPTQVKLGNIFVTGEKVQIQASVPGGTGVDWAVSDFQGAKLDAGSATVDHGQVTITPGRDGPGYYLMHLTAKAGDQVLGQGRTSYAVVPPVDITGMADSKFGVMTHFAKDMPTDIIPLMVQAGIAHARDEQPWNAVETQPDRFDFAAPGNGKLETYMAELTKAHITPLEVLAFGNKLHFGAPGIPVYQAAPYDPAGCDAYARYCLAVADHYGPRVPALEIWNEYNGSFCQGPADKDRPRFYTRMLQTTYEQIKAKHPEVQVIGGAAVKVPLPYFEKMFKLGALQYMDGIAVHPYQPTPEGVERELAALVELMQKYHHGQARGIWVTECGTWEDQSDERASAASYLVRMYTLLLTQPEVQRIYWYLLRDYAQFKNLGLVHGDQDPMGKYTPVAGYPAFANLVQQLYQARFVQRESTDSRTRIYRFDKADRSIWVCWSTSGTAQLLFTTGSPLRLVDMVGAEKPLMPVHGQAAVSAGAFPIYVVADPSAVTAVRELPRKDQVLADSVRDFSDTQGQAGWTYGYYQSNRDGSASYVPANVKPMNWAASKGDWEDRWQGPGENYSISASGTHPSAIAGGQAWTIRRWTSNTQGQVHITVALQHGQKKGDGVGCKVFLDDTQVYSQLIAPGDSADIDLSATVKQGTHVDFAVTPGPGIDNSFDACGFQATILTPSAP